MSIRLHAKKGLNVKFTYCPRCRGVANELIMLGSAACKHTCDRCHVVSYGSRRCLTKGCTGVGKVETIREEEKLPASQLCDVCTNFLNAAQEAFKTGGIMLRCTDCKGEALVRGESDISRRVRAHLKINAPKGCGVEVTKVDCPLCSKQQNRPVGEGETHEG